MKTFCAEMWPEDEVPKDQKNCEDCGLFQQGTRMIWGEGNPYAPIMIILDNPGAREDREGNAMVCGTRQTLQEAVYDSGLDQGQVYVTYLLKRRPVRAYDKEKTRAICAKHLQQQLQDQNPSIVVCLGNVVVQSFFRNPDLDVKGLRGNWHQVEGYPTVVSYHPLAARRRPNLYPLLREDMRLASARLKTYL